MRKHRREGKTIWLLCVLIFGAGLEATPALAQVELLWRANVGSAALGSRIALADSGELLAAVPRWEGSRSAGDAAVLLFSRTGKSLWKYTPPPQEQAGGVAVSPDGQTVFCDYWTKPRVAEAYPYTDTGGRRGSESEIMPLDTVAYEGGIYCFDAAGKPLWKTHEEAIEVCCPGSSPMGLVTQATNDLLLVVKPGEECERALTVLDFSGRILLHREFTQEDQVQRVALSPDGQRVIVGFRDRVAFINMLTGGTKEVTGVGLAPTEGATSGYEGALLVAKAPGRVFGFGLVDDKGELKWSFDVPDSWPSSVTVSTGPRAGESVSVAPWPLIGGGPRGTSVVLVRGPRRVLFRFPPGSYSPEQIELPTVQDAGEATFLSPDGTLVAVARTLSLSDGTQGRRLRLSFLDQSGSFLGELNLGEWPNPWRRPLAVAFSNPAKYVAVAAGPNLYFIEVSG